MNRDQKPKSTPRKDPRPRAPTTIIFSGKALRELCDDHRDLMRAASALCGLLKTTSSGAGFSREAMICLRDLEALLVDYDPTNV